VRYNFIEYKVEVTSIWVSSVYIGDEFMEKEIGKICVDHLSPV